MKHNCSICGKEIVNKIKSAKYCSDECSKIGKKETQKLLMREKRKKEKEQKIEELKKSQANKINTSKSKPKKIRDIEKYYQKKIVYLRSKGREHLKLVLCNKEHLLIETMFRQKQIFEKRHRGSIIDSALTNAEFRINCRSKYG